MKSYFTISRLHRNDVIDCFRERNIELDESKLTDEFMEELASKLGDDYCEQLFRSSLEIIAKYILDRQERSE